MTMDFVNADVTNVLRLIGEVSNLNVIWGPDVTGKVSMRLKNVPWEQALDLILANNDLASREEGNIIWVAPKTRIRQLEEEERRKREEAIAEQERLRKLREEQEKQVELVTEYFPLDFADINEIKTHIAEVLTERGKVTIDTRTNTLIVLAIPENIEKARKIVERFDTPVKQIVIEARIVDATTNFTRDLGVVWQNTTSGQRRSSTNVPFGVPTDSTGYTGGVGLAHRQNLFHPDPGHVDVQSRVCLWLPDVQSARVHHAERTAGPCGDRRKGSDYFRPQGDCQQRRGGHHQ